MDRIFKHKDGLLFLKIDEPNLRGIFRLQLVSPLSCTIDPEWFDQNLMNGNIVECLIPEKDDFEQSSNFWQDEVQNENYTENSSSYNDDYEGNCYDDANEDHGEVLDAADDWEILGLPPNSSQEEIDRAWENQM